MCDDAERLQQLEAEREALLDRIAVYKERMSAIAALAQRDDPTNSR